MVGVIIFSTVVFSKAAFYESESNNTWGTANSIPINSEITGNLQTYSDVDYYKFTVAVPSGIQLVFNHDVPADYASWDVELYNANAEEITSFNSSQYNVTKTSSYIRVPAGTYYIEVSNSTWDDIGYNLTVSAKDESASNFEKEVNNTWGTAQTISINKEYTCNLQTYDDVDYYKFTVTASTSIQLEFRHEVPTDYAGWDVELFYANGNELTSAFSSQYDVDVLSSNTELSTGVYYIMVDNTTWSDIDYKLTVLSPIDKTPPVITVGAYTTTPTNQNVTVTVSTNEGTLNATSHTFTANGSFDFIATDAAGNLTTRTVAISNIDKTAPATPTLSPSTTVTTNSNVFVTITYPADADVKEYMLSAGVWTPYTEEVNISANNTVFARCKDTAGNYSSINSISISNIDKAAPVVVGVSNNETYIAGRTITFNEGTAILDGNPIVNGSEVSSIGMHILIVTDTVGNSTTIIFTIIDPVTKISLNVTNLKWAVGRTGTFIVTILPSNATNKAVSWKSSNTAVTTVDNAGILTAKGVGKATLTCTAKDGSGIKATCTITVVPKTPTNLKAVKASTTSIKLTWSPVSGVTGYYLFRSTSKTGTYSYIKTITATSYINTGLTKGKTYYYKVQAFKMVGSTPYRSASTAISSATL